MKFSIAYAAKWGHALHVELTFAAADGYQDTMDLPMTTRDGYHWEPNIVLRTLQFGKSAKDIESVPDDRSFLVSGTVG